VCASTLRLHRILLLAVTAIAIAACGGGGPTAAPTVAATLAALATPAVTEAPATPTLPPLPTQVVVDPCFLVMQDEADQVAGTPLASGIPSGPAGQPPTLCMWTGAPTGPLGQVEVYVGDGAKKFLDIDKDTLKHEFAPIAGLGDEAWAEADAVFFRKGAVWVGLHLVRLNDPTANAAALELLARRIATRF
jgi:hypothetical protein